MTRAGRLKGGRVLVWWSGGRGNERESTNFEVDPVPEHGMMEEPGLTRTGPESASRRRLCGHTSSEIYSFGHE